MADGMKEITKMALGAVLLMMAIGMTFVLGGQLQKTICESIDSGAYSSGTCTVSVSNTNESQSQAFNQTGAVITAIVTLVSFVTIIILVNIVRVVWASLKGFKGGGF